MYFKRKPFHAQVVFQVLVNSLHSSVKIDQKITWVLISSFCIHHDLLLIGPSAITALLIGPPSVSIHQLCSFVHRSVHSPDRAPTQACWPSVTRLQSAHSYRLMGKLQGVEVSSCLAPSPEHVGDRNGADAGLSRGVGGG